MPLHDGPANLRRTEMEARQKSGLRLTATQDLTGKITITEQIWALLTPQNLRLRKTVDAYCRIFQQFASDVQVHGHWYRASALATALDVHYQSNPIDNR